MQMMQVSFRVLASQIQVQGTYVGVYSTLCG